jgi:hypothetical protein
MSRTLGSFNRRVNLPSHPEDSVPTHSPRIAAFHTEDIPAERGGTTGAAKFAAGRGRSGRGTENRRFAGDIMNIDLSTGLAAASSGQNVKSTTGMRAAFAPPLSGSAESRTASTGAVLPDMYYYQQ